MTVAGLADSRDPLSTETHKHTPGPWKVYRDHPSTPSIRYIRTGDGLYEGEIATMYGSDGSDADALLIAAAPDLLQGMKGLYRAYVNLLEAGRDRIAAHGGQCDPVDVMERGDPWLKQSREIIAKAEGRS